MALLSKIWRHGTGFVHVIPAAFMRQLGWKRGDRLLLTIVGETLVATRFTDAEAHNLTKAAAGWRTPAGKETE